MKKFIALAIVVLCVMSVSAQKGTMYLGTSNMGGFGYSDRFQTITGVTYTDYEDKSSNLSIGLAPEVGYFIQDNLALGLGIAYTYQSADSGVENADKVNTNIFAVNPYARYYFVNKDKFRMYGQLGLTYATSKDDTDGSKAKNIFDISVRPGISYNVSDRVALTATYGYLGYQDYKDNYSEFGLNLDMSTLLFGFSVAF